MSTINFLSCIFRGTSQRQIILQTNQYYCWKQINDNLVMSDLSLSDNVGRADGYDIVSSILHLMQTINQSNSSAAISMNFT